ncbi:STP1 protein [Plasmodium ovale curtisi]|uniref:STP1 protein n=1 Tax=Plasmodium ovale curtisi TaxID=864141 RepID=A0A1A8XA98_PLAOA|nr:STP1 protein [Plasmodium ovale curtisi]
MADYSGYTTLTHHIPIDTFFFIIKSPIKKLIHKYGHKNCGLRHEELCEEIKKIISDKKKIELKHMDQAGKKKWNNDWNSKKYGFFNKLFEGEGFINMCYPPKEKGNQNLQKLKSRHIQFCKDKDVKQAAVEANPVYHECVKYNSWINTETASLTREFLRNVKDSSVKVVTSYFTTKEKPRGYDPRDTYPKSKLDCTEYNPPPRSHPQRPTAKTPPDISHIRTISTVRQESQGKSGISVPDGDESIQKTETDVKKYPTSEPPPFDSVASSLTKTHLDDTSTDKDTHVVPKVPGSPINGDRAKIESIPVHPQHPTDSPPHVQAKQNQSAKTPPRAETAPPPLKDRKLQPVKQDITSPTATTSLSSSISTVKDTTSSQTPSTSPSLTITSASSLDPVSPLPSDPLLPAVVIKDQDRASHLTTTPVTSANTHSAKTLPEPSAAVPSLTQSQPPAVSTPSAKTEAQGPGTPASSSTSTFTTPVTTTTMSPAADTSLTMSTIQAPIPSTEQVPSVPGSKEPPPPSASGEPKATVPTTEHQQTVTPTSTPLSGSNTGGVSVPTQPGGDPVAKSDADVSPKYKVPIQASVHLSRTPVTIADNTLQKIPHHSNQQYKRNVIQNPPRIAVISSAPNKSDASVNTSKDGSTVRNNKNDNPNIIPESIPPLMDIIPTFLVILGTLTLLFQLYKYTPFGFLLGRRRKKKKRDLRRIFEIPEKPTYESPNIAAHEWEDPKLVGKTVGNDIYIKLLKMKRYEQAIHKKKKKKKTTLIEVHMEVLEQNKNDQWKLHKGDFLEICLRGFINEENETYKNFTNSELIVNNIKNEKTIEDIQKQEILWNNWIENHRNILEQWKEKEWFHILKNKWRNEQQKYKEKNNKLRENILNEQETYSIVSQKEIWKQWISKQANLIDLFNKEDWFNSMVYAQNKEKNNYHVNEYKNTSITSQTELKNEKTNYEHCRRKNIIQKLMIQIHMMVLEECIKEDIIKHKELCIDNFIEDIHNQNNYDENRNILQCDTYDFDVLEF